MKNIFSLSALLIVIVLVSCKKENSESQKQNALVGNWKFISMHAITESTNQYTDISTVFKTVTASDYTTTNNGGTLSITAEQMNGEGLTYSISDTATALVYEDGVLTDSTSFPFDFDLAATNSSSSYKLIGSDSIYFPGGGFISSPSLSGTQQNVAGGAKFSISSNLLTMVTIYNKDTTVNNSGITETINNSAIVTSMFQKQ